MLPLRSGIRALALTLLLAATAYGQTRIAGIVGPASAGVGELVELRAESTTAKGFTWLTVGDAKYRQYEGGTVLVFAAPKSGVYEFALVAVTVTVDGQPIVDIQKHRIEIVGPGPGPLPPPGPGPTPPVPPNPPQPSVLGLVEFARTAPRDAFREKIAENFGSVSGRIADGTLKDLDAIDAAMTAANQASFPGAVPAGWKAWFVGPNSLEAKLDALDAAGKLKTPADYRAAFLELAEGLGQ